MQLLNITIPKLFADNGAPDAVVHNVASTLDQLGSYVAKNDGAEVNALTPKYLDYIDGFISGVAMMLYTCGNIEHSQYRSIIDSWKKLCELEGNPL
jgi:hypothetical protein